MSQLGIQQDLQTFAGTAVDALDRAGLTIAAISIDLGLEAGEAAAQRATAVARARTPQTAQACTVRADGAERWAYWRQDPSFTRAAEFAAAVRRWRGA